MHQQFMFRENCYATYYAYLQPHLLVPMQKVVWLLIYMWIPIPFYCLTVFSTFLYPLHTIVLLVAEPSIQAHCCPFLPALTKV